MNLSSIDMNLLVVLHALLLEGHVGRAAQRVGLSQPAASHALKRLRDLFGDPLLVQASRRMLLTPRAQELREPLAAIVGQVRSLFEPVAFDPASSQHTYRVMMPDVLGDQVAPRLVELLSATAPGIHVQIVPWRGPESLTEEYLQSIDVLISSATDRYTGFEWKMLYTDRDVLAVRDSRSNAMELGRLDKFLAARHVAVVGAGEREDIIDAWLRELGHARNVMLSVPNYLTALRIAARTDLVAFVPSRLVAAVGSAFGLRAIEPPIDPGTDQIFLYYPRRARADQASIWIRTLIQDIGRELTLAFAESERRKAKSRTRTQDRSVRRRK